ncbi:hypothetical protein JYU34_008303 [Plutella xylostella]|uniref:Uncharacterized protein n=1 Tax=Plutella xylostella TaxID=51655 RepID=A0ABQ7QP59_PLUXY|nr:hypothetical protein JYU34_008303 [Plutella xylostella]
MDFALNNDIYIENLDSPEEREDLFACRVCLATDIKLFDIHECDLAENFEAVMGVSAPQHDGLPQHLCHYCFTLLQKYLGFRDKYNRSQTILQTAVLLSQPITTEYLRMIDRDSENLSIPLAVHSVDFIDYEIIEDEEFQPEAEGEEQDVERKYSDTVGFEEFQEEQEAEDTTLDESALDQEYVVTVHDDAELGDVIEVTNIKLENPTTDDDTATRPQRSSMHPNIEVITLTTEEQIEEMEQKKYSPRYMSGLHKCDKCYRGFVNAATYRSHMIQHDPANGAYECGVCESRFSNLARLKVHVASVHEKRYVCKLCQHRSSNSHRALAHQKYHEGLTYDCKYCGESFAKSTACMLHIRRKHAVSYMCESCGAAFHSTHALHAHPPCNPPRQQKPKNETWLYCDACQVEFRGVDAFNKHMETSSRHCEDNVGHDHTCIQCGDSFVEMHELDEHQLTHARDSIKCPECNSSFPSHAALTAHCHAAHKENYDMSNPRFPCRECSRTFTTSVKMLAHARTHETEKPYVCPFCQKAFRFPQYLQIHVRTHTGERPYVCNVCNMAFQAKANLNRHLKVHTGDKPYMCDLCGKSFTQSNSMKVHVKTVHLKMPDPYRSRRKFYRRARPDRVDE